MKKAVVFNLGCKVNQYECDVLAEGLTARGFEVSINLIPADLYIVNTCAVTQEAERKSRQMISRCKKLNSDAKIIICGCASQQNPDVFLKDNVIFVAGTAFKETVYAHIDDEYQTASISDLPMKYEPLKLSSALRARAFVKIQDGCNNFCSYCIIPYLRGRSRSRNLDEIVAEVTNLSSKCAEIVLTGINLMQYGLDIGTNLTELIRALKDVDVRIRLGSFYAEAVNAELLDALFSLKKFCPHFHLSLQSGDNEVLRAMNRRYTAEVYLEKIELIRSRDKNACITTDIIVGYPTETDENFENTKEFVKKAAFSDIHIFPFSPRKGTKSYSLKSLPPEAVKSRVRELNALKSDLKTAYACSNIGKKQTVLIEESVDGYYTGYSEYYIKCYTLKQGEIITIDPKTAFKDGLRD